MSAVDTRFRIIASVAGTDSVRRMSDEMRRLGSVSDNLKRTFGTGLAAFGGFFTGAVLINAALNVIRYADTYKLLEARVKQATNSLQEADYAFRALKMSAERTGAPLEAAVQIFQRISFSRKDLQATVNDMLAFTDTVQKLGIISGASPEALRYGLLQLGQSLSSNIVRAEEFNSIMENIPAVGVEIAKQFGISTGELRKLVITGKVESKDLFTAVLASADEARKKFESLPITVGREFQKLAAIFVNLSGVFNESSGAISIIGTALRGVGIIAKSVGLGIISVFETAKAVVLEVTNAINIYLNTIITGLNRVASISDRNIGTNFGQIETLATRMPGSYFSDAGTNMFEAAGKIDVFGINRGSSPQADSAPDQKTLEELRQKYQELLKSAGEKAKKSEAERATEKASEYLAKQREELETLKLEATLIGKTSIEVAKLKDAREQATNAAERAANLSGVAREKFLAEADAIAKQRQEVMQLNYEQSRTFGAGAKSFLNDYVENARNSAEQVKNVMSNAFRGAEDALVEFTTTGKLNFKDFARSIIEDLIRINIQRSILAPVAGFLGGMFANGGIMTSSGPMPLRAYARGGIANSPQMAIFGEGSMPEAYVPLPDGRRIPVALKGGGGANVTVNVNMANGGTDTRADTAQAAQFGAQIANAVRGVILNEKRPGGLLAAV